MADFKRLRVGAPLDLANVNSASFTNFAIDAATDRVEWVFQALEATTITKLGFRYGARSGTPVQHKISLQGVDASGNPDGTIKGGGTPCSALFTPPADATWNGLVQWVTADNGYLCTRGEWLSIVIEPIGTPDGTNNASFSVTVANVAATAVPYAIQNNAGARTRQAVYPLFGYQSASLSYGQLFQDLTSTAFHSGNTPDEYAAAFSLDAGWGSTYKVVGVRFSGQAPGAGLTAKLALYDGTTELQNMTWDSDYVRAIVTGQPIELYFDEANLAALDFGSTYRIGIAPQSASGAMRVQWITLAAAGDRSAFPGGTNWYLSTRTDSGAWSDDTSKRPLLELIIDDWTEPAGGGSGIGALVGGGIAR